MDLAGTPRLLNCVNYDIYLLNTKNGNVERLTTLEDTGEYNPSWSPDGKRIVHDVTDANFHTLYITDIKTRVSKPLPGADGGNDADWSPDGSWILFDRGPYGDPSLYLLPPAGGTPTLLVENAISGDWSPDSQRVVFEREGMIWTANIAGGDETLITETGHNPVWSKDGLWIAYDLDGDLWKVGVDLNGSRTGEPVQLTSGPVTEGGATWSNNGKSLAFSSDASGDFDIWEISSAAGAPIQLRGTLGFGDYDPAYSNNGQYIAYDGAMEPSLPHVESDARLNSYALVDWPTGQLINVHIDDPATGRTPDYRTAFTPDGSANLYSFQPDLDLRPGFVIQARSMYFEKVLVVSELAATSVDAENGIVSGVATSNHAFYMVTDGDHFRLPIGLDVTADENGNWSVDFSGYDTPLPWEWFTGGEMFEWDEDGDLTHARWHVHQEVVEVWLAQNEIRAFDWPVDTDLQVNVYDPETDQVHEYFERTVPQDWFDGSAVVINAGDLQLLPGMTVTVTDGSTEKSTVIQNIKITSINVDNDIVSGYAPPNASLDLGSFEDSPVFRFFNADDNGDWFIDYREPSLNGVAVDLNPGDDLRLFLREEDKDSTVWEAFAPHTRFTVFPEWEWFDGYDWPDGAMILITVEGKPECETAVESPGFFFNGPFGEGCDVVAGDAVTFTDGVTTRTHIVQNLAVTNVDLEANTIAGTADEGAIVYAWVHEYGYDMQLQVEDGTWLADFGSAGLDLVENMGGRSEIRDEFGNATAVDWYIPNPRFVVFPEWEWFDGLDWPDGALVDITVLDKPECTTQVESWGSFFNGPFGEGCDLAIGDTVTFTDVGTLRIHTVQNLAVTAAHEVENTVIGTADAFSKIYVWPHATGQQLEVTADENGNWQVDFTDVFDLVPGECGRSEVRDEAGNATAVDWCVPNPHVVVQITDDWFRAETFLPNTALNFWIYDAPGGSLLLESTTPETDAGGTITHWVGDQVDLLPGYQVIVSDGVTTKEIMLEALSFDVFDASLGLLQGTAPEPFGRSVWVGIGWENDGWSMDITTNDTGTWIADFGMPVPAEYDWVVAQIFDLDGDASEVRPAIIID